MSISVSHPSFCGGVYLEICPYCRNCYSCELSPMEGRLVSDDLLQAAALVERGAGGFGRGLFWESAFHSTRWLSCGWSVRVATEQKTVHVELVSPAWYHYSTSTSKDWALEIACQLWVHSAATVLAEN